MDVDHSRGTKIIRNKCNGYHTSESTATTTATVTTSSNKNNIGNFGNGSTTTSMMMLNGNGGNVNGFVAQQPRQRISPPRYNNHHHVLKSPKKKSSSSSSSRKQRTAAHIYRAPLASIRSGGDFHSRKTGSANTTATMNGTNSGYYHHYGNGNGGSLSSYLSATTEQTTTTTPSTSSNTTPPQSSTTTSSSKTITNKSSSSSSSKKKTMEIQQDGTLLVGNYPSSNANANNNHNSNTSGISSYRARRRITEASTTTTPTTATQEYRSISDIEAPRLWMDDDNDIASQLEAYGRHQKKHQQQHSNYRQRRNYYASTKSSSFNHHQNNNSINANGNDHINDQQLYSDYGWYDEESNSSAHFRLLHGNSESSLVTAPPANNSNRQRKRPRRNILTKWRDYLCRSCGKSSSTSTSSSLSSSPSSTSTSPNSSSASSKYTNILQMFVLIALAGLTYYSHRRVEAHKLQLRQFDEERTHILEQMIWIEKKKSRAHTVTHPTTAAATTQQRLDALSLSSLNDLTQQLQLEEEQFRQQQQQQQEDEEDEEQDGDGSGSSSSFMMSGPLNRQNSGIAILRNQMEKMQLRIQLNDRHRLLEHFKNRPMHLTLGVKSTPSKDTIDASASTSKNENSAAAAGGRDGDGNNSSAQHHYDFLDGSNNKNSGDLDGIPQHNLVIALSEDTPHATSVFLQQVEEGLWNAVQMKRFIDAPSIIEATTPYKHTTPVLSFVEASIGCHETGSVSVHQIDDHEELALVVRIRLSEDVAPTNHDEVCIGKLISGMNSLEELPLLPRDVTEDIATVYE